MRERDPGCAGGDEPAEGLLLVVLLDEVFAYLLFGRRHEETLRPPADSIADWTAIAVKRAADRRPLPRETGPKLALGFEKLPRETNRRARWVELGLPIRVHKVCDRIGDTIAGDAPGTRVSSAVTGSLAPDDPVDRPDNDVAGSDLESARELVLRAYAAAKASGRADWRRMTTAVLKNRLLDLTDRTFDEADWGATTMREFVERLAPTLALDFSTRPTTVIMHPDVDVGDQERVVAVEPARRRGDWRIRQDLWDAVVDCVSGHAYVWDGAHAVPRSPEELDGTTTLVLPTVTPEELSAWREAFAAELQETIDGDVQDEFARWRQSPMSSQMLPQRYRNRWFGVLKRHVRARLDSWFANHGVEPPPDWIASSAPARPRRGDETEHLRSVALRAVRMMTHEELERLDLPASVVARMSR